MDKTKTKDDHKLDIEVEVENYKSHSKKSSNIESNN
jgi:hypothetical protein